MPTTQMIEAILSGHSSKLIEIDTLAGEIFMFRSRLSEDRLVEKLDRIITLATELKGEFTCPGTSK